MGKPIAAALMVSAGLAAISVVEAQGAQTDGLSFNGGRFSVEIVATDGIQDIEILDLPEGLAVRQRGATVEVSGPYDWTVCSDRSAPDLGVVRVRAPAGVRVEAVDAVSITAKGQLGASAVSGCSRLDAEGVSGSLEAAGAGVIRAQRAVGSMSLYTGGSGTVQIDTVSLDRLSAEANGGSLARFGEGHVETMVLETGGRARVELAASIGDAMVVQGSRAPVRLAEVEQIGGVRQGCEPGLVTTGDAGQAVDLPDISTPQSCRW